MIHAVIMNGVYLGVKGYNDTYINKGTEERDYILEKSDICWDKDPISEVTALLPFSGVLLYLGR